MGNYQADLLKFTFPHFSWTFFLFHTSWLLEAFSPPFLMLDCPPTNHSHIEFDSFPPSPVPCLWFFFSPLSLCPLLTYSRSDSAYLPLQICITKAYHRQLAYGKGRILFWRVKKVKGKEKWSRQK